MLRQGRVAAAGAPGGTPAESLIVDVHGVRAAVTRPGPGDLPRVRFLGTVAGSRRRLPR
ncbi:hypothetical protein [Streptomyces sp. SAI-229]|uniref:hypothetical protein n=1 Tax=Streptomyces sp. SAI-229 TaxID=3377731 RepID=UPI003C7B75C1